MVRKPALLYILLALLLTVATVAFWQTWRNTPTAGAPDLNLKVYEMSGQPLTVDRLEQLLPPGMMLRNQMNYYVCGPGPMVADVGDVLSRLHVPADRVKTERFDA